MAWHAQTHSRRTHSRRTHSPRAHSPRTHSRRTHSRRTLFLSLISWLGVWLTLLAVPAPAADIKEARSAFYRGDYEACIELASSEVERGIWNEIWSRQWIECLLATGRYAEAVEVYEKVADRFSNSIPLRILAAEAYRFSGDDSRATLLLEEIPQLINAAPWRFSDRNNLLAIGGYLLERGEDPRVVLREFYDRALAADPSFVDAHVAIADLALDKADYQEAVKSLTAAIELRPEDPHLHVLLARAWAASDAQRASHALQAALQIDPAHVDGLLMQSQDLIDAEDYDAAELLIEDALQVNPSHPHAWSQRAAVAHLLGNYQHEGECRQRALATWRTNPEVDYLIGQTLSQHYRFEESVRYQRRALHLSPNYLPAKFQLAQDLLRLGQDDEGWSLVDQVAQADQYHVVAFNLKTLQSRLAQFTTLQGDGFIVRMDTREAKIYGPRVLELLTTARQVLCAKYDYELSAPVTVEIFTRQSDFAIRTFGLPGGAGFLGVCFGNLITANSPASQGNTPSNWESVLWHEFCHVVTLQKSNNRMPRWLSEGISVYEELERDPRWGQSMTPANKQMLLSKDFVPLSELSSAFLQPASPLHLHFAYFESSLAVRYLVERHGLPLLQKLLVDLGAGVPLADAMQRRYGQPAALNEDFESYAQELARGFLPETDFSPLESFTDFPQRGSANNTASESASESGSNVSGNDVSGNDVSGNDVSGNDVSGNDVSGNDVAQWLVANPNSYFGHKRLVEQYMAAEQWNEARAAAERLVELYPQDASVGGGLMLLADVARHQSDLPQERSTLAEVVRLASDNLPALQRLLQLERGLREAGQPESSQADIRQAEDWERLADTAHQLLAVQPLLPAGHQAWVEAMARLGRPSDALQSYRALLELEPLDPSELRFQLAQALTRVDRVQEARREVLLALEETPRYRGAQKLLVELYRRVHPQPPTIAVAAPDTGQPPRPK